MTLTLWLCVDQEQDGPRVTNLPGGPDHCYFIGKDDRSGRAIHLPDCGWKVVFDADSWRARSDFVVVPNQVGESE